MVSGSRIEGGPQILSAGVRKTIQSIKEIVGNHSDAEIYVVLRETNMDPNETAQKLLSQDPFHEVKRKRDRKKEVSGYKSSVAAEPRINSEVVLSTVKSNAHFDQNARRGGYTRNVLPDAGASKEFRVVRDNRANQNDSEDLKYEQSSTSNNERVPSNLVKSNSAGTPGRQKPQVAHHSSQALDEPADLQHRLAKDANLGGNHRKDVLGEKRLPVSHAASRMQVRVNESQPRLTTSSSNYVVGVYSSSSDPVHVPSLNSRSATNIGAIKREVGVVGPRRQSFENSGKSPSSQSSPLPIIQSGQEDHSRESTRPFSAISKGDQPSQNTTKSAIPVPSASRSFSSNQHGSRSHQLLGRQKALQPNKEWKPKSTLKPNANGPGVIGTPPKIVSPPADNTEDLKTEAAQMQVSMSQLNISENQNVIIAAHIRVSDADRCRLTFGSMGTEFESSIDSVFHTVEGTEESSTEASLSVSASGPESSTEEPAGGKQREFMDDHIPKSGSNSPASGAAVSDNQPYEKRESSSPENLDNYADVGLVRNNSPSYSPELLQTQDASELPSLSSYETQMGYDMPYFRPLVDETARGGGLPSQQEVLGHTANSSPSSSIAMVQQQQQLIQQQQQQQQQQLAQMYPQVHVPHFTNLMPYHRQFISPVYVPQMPMPGYSNTSAYPQPTNGSSYLVMPGNNSHLTASGLKYGVQQFKPVPTGSPTGFGNFTSPSGYAINTPGVVGSATGHEDSSRLKYKDSNLYVPNVQAETSGMWINPRDLTNLQPTSYYNMPGQSPHAAYLPSHSGHASFNAAGAAQSSHMQFPGMYHPPTQATAMASAHHLGAAIGGNVGVGVAAPAPGAQPAAAYQQQPQLGHLNWPGNF